jgi:hypothetical protein
MFLDLEANVDDVESDDFSEEESSKQFILNVSRTEKWLERFIHR